MTANPQDDSHSSGLAGYGQLIVALGGFFSLVGAAIVATALAVGDGGGRIFGVLVGAAMLVFGVVYLVSAVRERQPVALEASSVSIRHGLSTTMIPLAEIHGVGLRFQYRRPASGWYLTVWDGQARPHTVTQQMVNAHNWTPKMLESKGIPFEDPDTLAASRPGQVAGQIYRAAKRVQPEDGPLLAQHAETTRPDRWAGTDTYAYWSPGNGMGRFK